MTVDADDIMQQSYQILKRYHQYGMETTKGEEGQYWCDLKSVHSQDVLVKGEDIIAQEPALLALTPEDLLRLRVALLLHDIGRFFEDVQQIGVKFDHGEKAVELLQQEENTFFHHSFILLSIRYHNKKDLEDAKHDPLFLALTPEEQATAMLIMQLVRDADKISNLLRTAEKGIYVSLVYENNGKITPEAWDQMCRRVNVDRQNCYTVLDSIICLVSWLADLNFVTSLKILTDSPLVETLTNEFIKYGGNRSDTAVFTKTLQSYLE